MSKTEFDVFCPTCNTLVAAKVVAEGNGGFRSDAVNPFDEVDTEYHGEHYYICVCGRCSQPFMIRQSLVWDPRRIRNRNGREGSLPDGDETGARWRTQLDQVRIRSGISLFFGFPFRTVRTHVPEVP